MRPSWVAALIAGLAAAGLPGQAAEINVAVAANFTQPAEEIAAAFGEATGDRVLLSFGATGGLYTQIVQGAPFAILLAADSARPARAVREGLGVEGSVFTYAVGRLVLYGPSLEMSMGDDVLRAGAFTHVAVADPEVAPYGAAAMAAIAALGLTDAIAAKLVTGENISQVLQFVESGNAELGFVALSQVIDRPASEQWRVPAGLHPPIRQDAVLLMSARDDATARAFLDFLKGPEAQAIIEKYGYEVPG